MMRVSWDLKSTDGRDDLSVIPSISLLVSKFELFRAWHLPVEGRVCHAWFFLRRRPKVGKNLYVGNLSYGVTEGDLQTLFESHGEVQSARVIMDRETKRSKGFGFVEMGNDQEAKKAIAGLNGQDHDGRALTVNEARPREERSSRGNGGSGGSRRY